MNSRLSVREWGRRAVLRRLAVLERELKRLQRRPDADSIHDTRVAGRRLRASLRHLEGEFHAGQAQRLRNEVAQVARLLGEIRDLDILVENLAPEARRAASPFQTLLTSHARRRARLLATVAPAARALSERLEWWSVRWSATIRAGEGSPIVENFPKTYPPLIERYFRRGRKLVRRKAGPEELHRFRIRTKRIRYITEIYEELAPRTLRAALREFRMIQGILGDMQDQSMVIAYFERRLMDVRTPRRQTEYMRVLHRARVRQAFFRESFFRRWTRLEAGRAEKRWLAGIKAPSSAPSSRGAARTGRASA